VAVRPAESWDYWTRWITDPSRVGDPAYLANQSAYGALTRMAGGTPGLVVAGVLAVVLGGLVLAVATALWRRDRRVAALAVASLGPLLISPISWSHHWVWLVVPAVALLTRTGADDAPEAVAAKVVRVALVALVAAVALVRPLSVLPHGGGAEAAYDIGQRLASGVYVWLAVLLIGYLALAGRIERR
jgi:alpha-1,2-mannosyltransferase